MKKIICKNCGAEYDENLSKCPYCSTMNKKGAYRNFRLQFSSFIDRLIGLADEAERSVSRTIARSLFRALIIVVIVIALAAVFAYFANTNYYNDKEYDQKTYEKIVWVEDNLDRLNKAYEDKDYDTVSKLLAERNSISYSWIHYRAYELDRQYERMMDGLDLSEYTLRDLLYYLYYPDYYASGRFADEEEELAYKQQCAAIIAYLEGYGFDEEGLAGIYKKHKDSYGYLDSADLKQYLKGGDSNG